MALRSRFRPSLMISRYGAQVLAEPMAFEFSGALPLNPTPKSVITAMAGFELAVPFPLVGRFSGLGLGGPLDSAMAGFALPSRFHLPGGHISTPAPRR